jgi:hypothetical protein
MTKKPRTTGEHLMSIYGHIEGLKKSLNNLKSNHIFHLHQDVEKINDKFDKLLFWIVGGVGAIALLFLAQVLYFLSK